MKTVATIHELVAPLRDTAVQTALMLKRLGQRLDAFALDLARNVGVVTRDAKGLAGAARDQATAIYRATPRAARLAQVAAAIAARHRWLRLAAAARGDAGISDDDHRDLACRVTAAVAELRGGIAKLGQLASCRPDLIGPIWAAELAALQDDVPPIDEAAIRARIEAELGRPLEQVFAEFAGAPLAAASLAQVHAARLPDGTQVVVKVQVPGIEDVIEADIAALRALAGTLGDVPGLDLATLTDELARALASELDYAAEAAALRAFGGSGGGSSSSSSGSSGSSSAGVIVPRPIDELSTARVLVMTRIDGARLAEHLERAAPAERDRVLAALVDELAGQILVRGRVHADPHPGNFMVTEAGALALLDFGCTLELAPAERAAYARLVIAIGGGDAAAAARELGTLGFTADEPERLVAVAAALIGALRPGAAVSELDWEAALAEQLAAARRLGGLAIPRSFVLLGRVLATVAGLLARYRPAIQLHAVIARHLAAAIARP
jgi:ubiquinone biosynthesis protein